jgi:hypothetical protein
MVQNFGNAFLQKPPHNVGTGFLKTPAGAKPPSHHPAERKPLGAKGPSPHHAERKLTFTKILRWRLPDGQMPEPAVVEVAGTFTNWERKPLVHDKVRGGWHVTLHHIQGNRTHHYMLLADGKPVEDKHCDGTAVPNGAQELQFAITTARGPRVFMLFSQTK